MSRESVAYLLNKYGIKPDPKGSQNFLVSDKILEDIVNSAKLTKGDLVLEVGPGIGTLTTLLLQHAGGVVSVEQDERFRPLLTALAKVNPHLKLVFADILQTSFDTIRNAFGSDSPYVVVANIPYHITSRIISSLLSYPELPLRAVLLVQKEVAQRIVAKPGEHSKLSLSVQFYGKPEIAGIVPREHFSPKPKVDSAILSINFIHRWGHHVPEETVWRLIRVGFSAKRKTLLNNLMNGLHAERKTIESALRKLSIDTNIRAQALSLDQWLELGKAFPDRKE